MIPTEQVSGTIVSVSPYVDPATKRLFSTHIIASYKHTGPDVTHPGEMATVQLDGHFFQQTPECQLQAGQEVQLIVGENRFGGRENLSDDPDAFRDVLRIISPACLGCQYADARTQYIETPVCTACNGKS